MNSNMRGAFSAVMMMTSATLTACETAGNKTVIGGVSGAVLGAGAGAAATKGSTTGILIGAILGGLAGTAIGAELDEQDRKAAEQARLRAAETAASAATGSRIEWRRSEANPDGVVTSPTIAIPAETAPATAPADKSPMKKAKAAKPTTKAVDPKQTNAGEKSSPPAPVEVSRDTSRQISSGYVEITSDVYSTSDHSACRDIVEVVTKDDKTHSEKSRLCKTSGGWQQVAAVN